jgi:cholesterol 7-dehydrogenase
MFEIFILIFSTILSNYKLQILSIIIVLYLIYYHKLKFFVFIQKQTLSQGRKRISKTLPAYPNGWFVVLRSEELQIGQTKYIDTHGESLVVFRGNNKQTYVLSAYCPHLGANLGVEGRVVNDSCIQCPFHSWTFDGETGNCVIGKDKKVKHGIKYEYEYNNQDEECVENSKFEFKSKKRKILK